MDFMKAFMDQHMIAMIGEIVLFANTVTMAMPTRWRGNMFMDMVNVVFARLTSTRAVAGKRLNMKIKKTLLKLNGFMQPHLRLVYPIVLRCELVEIHDRWFRFQREIIEGV